jgi:hypothetical protein
MTAPATFSIADQIACVRREIGMRERVYPKWVAGGRMKQDAADRELAAMRAVLATLQSLKQATFAITVDTDGEGFMSATVVHRTGGDERRGELFGVEAQDLHARLCRIASRKEAR